jgi:hypothetical protein
VGDLASIGLKDIKDLAERGVVPAPVPGSVTTVDPLPGYPEPLLRLNVEASDETALASLRDEVLGIVRPD